MGKIKTTINIDEELWKKFSVMVIEKEGYRKKNAEISLGLFFGNYTRARFKSWEIGVGSFSPKTLQHPATGSVNLTGDRSSC